jgi:hypothetical protein
MKKTAVLLAAALAACGTATNDPASPIRAALPAGDALQIDSPNPNGGTAAVSPNALSAPSTAMTADGKSDLAVVSYLFAASVNWGVYATLVQVHLVTLLPPTTCSDASCTWGPGSAANDLNNWMLVVTKNGSGYDWALSGEPKSNPGAGFIPIISGTAYPGNQAGHGYGTFAVDFGAEATLDHAAGWTQQNYGTLTATYDARGPLTLQVVWLGTLNKDPSLDPSVQHFADAVYDFDQATRDLLVAWRTLPLGGAGYTEVALHTRWQVGGAGRADFHAYQNPVTVEKSECWDGSPGYLQTYDSYDGSTGLPVGDPALCVYQNAQFMSFPAL